MKKLMILLLVLTALLTACGQCEQDVTLPAVVQPTDGPDQPASTAPTRPPVDIPVVEEVPLDESTPFDPEECREVIGTWTMTVTIPSNYAKVTDFTGTASFPLIFNFTDDGRYTINVEPESFGDAIIHYETELANFMIEGYYKKFVAERRIGDLSDEEIEKRWANGELANAQKKAHTLLDDRAMGKSFGELARAGYYYVEDGVLYLSVEDGYENFQFKVDEEGLILQKSSRIRYYDDLCIRFPTVLKPVD